MITSAVSASLKIVRWPLALAAVGLLLAVFLITAQPAQGASVQVTAVGGPGVFPGDNVPVRIVVNLEGGDAVESTASVVIQGPSAFQFTVPLHMHNNQVTLASGMGILRGSVTHANDVDPGTTSADDITSAAGGTITFNGTFTVPVIALPGNYLVRTQVTQTAPGTAVVRQSAAQFTVEDDATPTPAPTASPSATATPIPTPTPTPTPTVAPTVPPTVAPTAIPPTPTPGPEEPPGINLALIIIVVLVVLAVAAGAFFYLRRRPTEA